MKIPELNILNHGTWYNPDGLQNTPMRFVLTYEIEYHHESYGETVINGIPYPLQKGTVTFNRPGDTRKSHFTTADRVKTDFFYFVLDREEDHNTFDYLIDQLPPKIESDDHLNYLWSNLKASFEAREDIFGETQAYATLISILAYIAQKEKSNTEERPLAAPSPHQRIIFESIQYMYGHLTEPCSLEDIAAHIGYSASHFSHLFKTYTKTTPHAYLLSLKIREAKYMLLNSNRSISEISEALAFGKICQFSRAFRNECHMTPGEFRKKRNEDLYCV